MRIVTLALFVATCATQAVAQEPTAAMPAGLADMMVRDLGKDRADALMYPDHDAERSASASWLMRWVEANRTAPAGTYVPPGAVGIRP